MCRFFAFFPAFLLVTASVFFAEDGRAFGVNGSCSHYVLSTGEEYYTGDCSYTPEDFLRKLIFGLTRAKTRCYYIQIDPHANCPDYQIGHASGKVGTPRAQICNEAKKAAGSPRGCQRKHCTPCTYDAI